MNTKEILNEINKTQTQLNKLQEQLKQAEAQEKFNSEFYTPIDCKVRYESCLQVLKTKNVNHICACFDWNKTPQGKKYWDDIYDGTIHLAESDIQQIKDWVINYLIQKEL